MQSLSWILWNLFLATIPVVAGWLLEIGADHWTVRKKRVPWLVWIPLAIFWFAFLPNTCYLLTEWRHFLFDPHFERMRDEVIESRPQMLVVARYGLFFLLYSGFGVLCFALSIRPIKLLLRKVRWNLWMFGAPFYFLNSLGVYLGLIVRLNSWDLVQRPGYVIQVAVSALLNPRLLETIIIFAVLLWLLYEVLDIWLDGVQLRLERYIVVEAEAVKK